MKSHRKSLLEKAETDLTNQIAVNFTQEGPGKKRHIFLSDRPVLAMLKLTLKGS